MNVFGIGLPEMAVIAAIALLVFGPKRLPELGRTLGRTLRGFQSASSEFEKEFRTAIATADTAIAIADPAEPVPLGDAASGSLAAAPTQADNTLVQPPAPAQPPAPDAPAG
jgi:sec-independent protein translocase protein TatA